jgi:hypothetical protein
LRRIEDVAKLFPIEVFHCIGKMLLLQVKKKFVLADDFQKYFGGLLQDNIQDSIGLTYTYLYVIEFF